MINGPRLSEGIAAPSMRPQPPKKTHPVLRNTPTTWNGGSTSSWSPANSYVAPVPNYTPTYSPPAYSAPAYSAPAAPAQTNWGGGGFSTFNAAPAAPAPAPEPPKPKPISEADWLAGDTEYQNEIKGYDDTLKDFLDRITTQKADFTTDYNTAVKGFNRNRDRANLSLGEDFTSRGLANSGMFVESRNKQKAQFEDQETGMTTAKDRALADFDRQGKDKEKATGTQKGNARRASLARMAQKQEF